VRPVVTEWSWVLSGLIEDGNGDASPAPGIVGGVARRVIALRLACEPDSEDEREGRMSARKDVLNGNELLVAVTDAMVEFHHRYHNRAPVIGKALLLGDALLACVLGGVYSDVEKTMIDLQGTTVLQETRSPFQEEMQHRFIAEVERLSGREVQAFISNSHADPDLEIELFVLKPTNGVNGERRPASIVSGRGYAYAWERPPAE
jgi:uncharacterized protein YbcI